MTFINEHSYKYYNKTKQLDDAKCILIEIVR